MKKIFFLSIFFIFAISILIMFTIKQQPRIAIDETIIDVSKFDDYKGFQSIWISGGKGHELKGYGEESIVREGWDLMINNSIITRIFQYTFFYQNKIK